MSDLVMWNMIIGFALPSVIALVQQPGWSDQVRSLVTAAVCIVCGFITAYFNGDFNAGDIVSSILVTLVAAITFYKGFWKPTGVAPKIENATSSTPPSAYNHYDHG